MQQIVVCNDPRQCVFMNPIKAQDTVADADEQSVTVPQYVIILTDKL